MSILKLLSDKKTKKQGDWSHLLQEPQVENGDKNIMNFIGLGQ